MFKGSLVYLVGSRIARASQTLSKQIKKKKRKTSGIVTKLKDIKIKDIGLRNQDGSVIPTFIQPAVSPQAS